MKQKRLFNKLLHRGFLPLLAVFLCLIGSIGQVWAAGNAYMTARSADPEKGLVALKNNGKTLSVPSAPSLSAYTNEVEQNYNPGTADGTENTSGYANPGHFYGWALPTRGWVFSKWAASAGSKTSTQTTGTPATVCGKNCTYCQAHKTITGQADHYQVTPGRMQSTGGTITASWVPDGIFLVTFTQTVGGQYTATYSYYESQLKSGSQTVYEMAEKSQRLTITPESGDMRPIGIIEGETVDKTFARDNVVLTCTASNFIGWYEIPTDAVGKETGAAAVKLSHTTTNGVHTLVYTPNKHANIRAEFKSLDFGTVNGDLVNKTNDKDATLSNKSVVVDVNNLHGTWVGADFTAAFGTVNGDADFNVTSVNFDGSSKVTILYSCKANTYTGSSVNLVLSTSLGTSKTIPVTVEAEEIFPEEACIEVNGVRQYQGTLAAMVTQANNMANKPTLKVMQNVTCNAALKFTKPIVFDINGKTITSTVTGLITVNSTEAEIEIVDNSFSKTGQINVTVAANSTVTGVTYAAAGKVVLRNGALRVENTMTYDASTAAKVKAYAVNIAKGGRFTMVGGAVTAVSDYYAGGVVVTTASDYATINGGTISAEANVNAYGVNTLGNTNITGATISATTTATGASAIYNQGGVTTLTDAILNATAGTTGAYGVNMVKAKSGKAYVNGGQINVLAEMTGIATSTAASANGVYVGATANVVVQQNAIINVSASGEFAKNVYGLQNLSQASVYNCTITATSPTTGAYAIYTTTGATDTNIEGGTYTGVNGTMTGGGLYHSVGLLTVDGGSFYGYADGSYGEATDVKAYGMNIAQMATIRNAKLWAESRGVNGKTVYGIFVSSALTAANPIVLENCDITARSNYQYAFATRFEGSANLNGCSLTARSLNAAYAYGIYMKNAATVVRATNCTADVSSYTTYAYGIEQASGSLYVDGGRYTVEAKQTTATAVGDSYLYGIHTAANYTADVKNAVFDITGSNANYSRKGYAAGISGTLIADGCSFMTKIAQYAYGIFGDGTSTLNLSNNTISTTTTLSTYSYGIYSNKNIHITSGSVLATAAKTASYAINLGASAVGEITGGKYKAIGTSDFGPITRTGTVGNVLLKGGYYATSANLSYYTPATHDVYALGAADAEYKEGYRYTINTENPSPYVCTIGSTGYATLESALQYAVDNSGKNCLIIMTQPYTLPAGDYRLPTNAQLLVPYSNDQDEMTNASPTRRTTVGVLDEYVMLTFAYGAKLNVEEGAKIEVSAEQYTRDGGKTAYVQGPYGRIHMEEGSQIVLNNNSKLYAWGYITGTGNIIAKKGSEVHEMFQIMDMKSLGNLTDYYLKSKQPSTPRVFPISQYYIQNIEAPVTYYYNSHLIGAMGVYHSTTGKINADNVKLVGTDDCLFQITTDDESTWVRKRYDATTDRQIWEVNSSAELGSMEISMTGYTMNSKDFVLPVTNNMTIHVLSGNLDVTQDAQINPGGEIEIEKKASLTILSGKKLYVVDNDVVDTYTNSKGEIVQDKTSYSIAKVVFSPSWDKGVCPRTSTINPGLLNIHGAVNVDGGLFTTELGASIVSTNADAGTINYFTAVPATGGTLRFITSQTPYIHGITTVPAKLKNSNGTYLPSASTPVDHTMIYMDGTWQDSYTEGCFYKQGSTFYAKPSEYVALANSGSVDDPYELENDDHTYTTVDDKLLILQGDCQWWEVEATATDGVFECKKTGYEGFYSYNEDDEEWLLVKRNVTFYSDEAGSQVLKVIETNYMGIPDQSIISTNPAKAEDATGTYQFMGWKSSKTGTEYSYADQLEKATEDMSYTPWFNYVPKRYTVTFKDALNGQDVPVETEYGTSPSYNAKKDATAQYEFFFQGWKATDNTMYAPGETLPIISGKITYTAIWAQVARKYDIVWMDGETVLETDENQAYGTATAFNGMLPTKATDDKFVYAFAGWKSSLTGSTYANGSTPAVAGATTYAAQFSTTPRYVITFKNYNGVSLQSEPMTQGETPSYNGVPARLRDADGYYVFIGWKNSNGTFYAKTATLPAVSQKETYTAQYDYVTELYQVTLHNVDGAGLNWSGKFGEGATPFYDPEGDDVPNEPAKASTADKVFPFIGWAPALEAVSATSVKEFSAQFGEEVRMYEITFTNLDGNGASETIEVAYGSEPVCPVAPNKETASETYPFQSWSPAIATVTGPATYTAQFGAAVTRTFTITFDLDNGEEDVIKEVAYNTLPTCDAPTKANDESFIYTFKGWDKTIVPATADAKYTAQYNRTLRTFNVTFQDWDGAILSATQSYAYGANPAVPTNPTRVGTETISYTFDGWLVNGNEGNKVTSIPTVSEEVIYVAHYTEQYNVAKVGSTAYQTWDAAYNAVSDGGTITILSDINLGTTKKTIQKKITLDLNGHTISGNVNQMITITGVGSSGGGKTLTITDSKENGAIKVTGSNQTAVYASRTSYTGSWWQTYYTYGSIVINGGGFIGTGSGASIDKYGNSNTITVNAGYFSHNTNITAASGKTLLTLTTNHPKYAQGYRYVVETAHKLTWNKNNGETPAGSNLAAGTPIAKPADPEKDGYEFAGWMLNGELVDFSETIYMSATADMTFEAQWLGDDIVADNEKITISESMNVNNVTISETGVLAITNDATVTVVNNLFLEATPDNNLGAVLSGNIQVQGDAYIDINMNGSGTMNKGYYYSFAVPFSVNVNGGVFRMEGDNAVEMVPNKGFMAYKYNEVTRANSGVQGEKSDNCWDLVSDGTFEPGVFYLILFSSNKSNTYRFKWNGSDDINNHADIWVESSTFGEEKDRGWHGIANNGLGYTSLTMNSNPLVMQTLNSTENKFEAMAGTQLAIGNPVFVQTETGTIDLSAPVAKAAAPRRVAAVEKTELMNVRLTREGADKHDDQIFFSASEEAENQYTIGHDVAKMFMGTAKTAQLWINAYGQRLVANEAVLNGDEARYPLSLYAPAAGDYVINVNDNDNANDNLYLLYEGAPVWNLSLSGYSIHLEAGTTEGYEIVLKRAPRVSTGMENVINGENVKAQKILFENKLFIICGEHVFDGQGKLVK